MTTHPDIVFISGHGHVYQDEDVRAGNIRLENAQLDTNILTYIQEGTLIWGNEESCFNAERALTDLYSAFNYNMSYDSNTRQFTTDRTRQATMQDGSSHSVIPRFFCANYYKRFPNMWLGDYGSQAEMLKDQMQTQLEASTPVTSPTSSPTTPAPTIKRGVTIVSGKTNEILFQSTMSGLRKLFENTPQFNTYVQQEVLSRLSQDEWSINLDHFILYFLGTFYTSGIYDGVGNIIKGEKENGVNIYINTCVGGNIIDQVLNNASSLLTWPRIRTQKDSNHESLKYDLIAKSCGRLTRFAESVNNSGNPDEAGLNRLRELDGGKSRKKKKKKKSKKKRGKKQTKRKRSKKQIKSKKYRKK